MAYFFLFSFHFIELNFYRVLSNVVASPFCTISAAVVWVIDNNQTTKKCFICLAPVTLSHKIYIEKLQKCHDFPFQIATKQLVCYVVAFQ